MTLDELKFIRFSINELMTKAKKEIVQCEDLECSSIQCKSLRIIEREIRLKTEDPRTGQSYCSCNISPKACYQHGIAAQLQRSQME